MGKHTKFPEINSIVLNKGFWITLETLESDVFEPLGMFYQKINANGGNYNLFIRKIRPFLEKHKFIEVKHSKPLHNTYISLTDKGNVLKAYITKLRLMLNE